MPNYPTTGKVIIAGAGPGDPELLTLKALRYLQQADVVLADRLVSEQVLSQYVKSEAEIIAVGKQCRRGASTPQETINELMVEYALKGKLVVRLKGGDVSIFSNVLDELQALKDADIAYEIIPGVTAALGAAAYAGIPLTARQYSTAVRFLTFYRNEVINDQYWKDLAATDDTLVFYMSSETLDGVVANLLKHGISDEKLLAVVEQATTPQQQVDVTNLYSYAENWKGKTFLSPALVIIGKVVALHQQFAWIANSPTRETYFKPVAKLFTASTVATEKANQNASRA
ncbi:uroporphyrinogen-III C-methyltransferase [Pseudoflavitalea sp. G-6-1-2]|uniref:uroporphyrinogen-III C-methyltransferase n=1 Tax=Pseudoflavitalea sp. G-6-1-2 TaxID=2728841 RepID=UPI00146E3BA8|nr:uroporphyrinogen-III C-methyltransferase [Pseudoflavitalea sp. G-6-1-2]NML19401.1 uroporphyrinogen-III C-methyltransferase [Pseudoflavitalea sp. G-6-1-2]